MPLSTYRQGISPQIPQDLMNLPNLQINPLKVQALLACYGISFSQLYWQLHMMQVRQFMIFLFFLTIFSKNGKNIISRLSINYLYSVSSTGTVSLSNYFVEFMSNQTFIYFWYIFINLCRLESKCFFYSRDKSALQKILPFERGTCFIWLFWIWRILFTRWKSMYLSISACFRHSQAILEARKKQGSMSILYPLCFLVDKLSAKKVQFPCKQLSGVINSYIFSFVSLEERRLNSLKERVFSEDPQVFSVSIMRPTLPCILERQAAIRVSWRPVPKMTYSGVIWLSQSVYGSLSQKSSCSAIDDSDILYFNQNR